MGLTQFQERKLLGTVLSQAVQLWLRAQVQDLDSLEVKISGRNRSLLTGYIPHVAVWASNAVYQGLHLSHIDLAAANIRINLGQVLKGKPLQLLAPIPVNCQVQVDYSHLNTSLQSVLLANAVTEFLLPLLQEAQTQDEDRLFLGEIIGLHHPQITCEEGQFVLATDLISTTGDPVPFVMQTKLELASCRELLLIRPCLQFPELGKQIYVDDITVDLGSDVEIQQLAASSQQLQLSGQIMVNP